jgi:hypothetical protein
VRVKEHPQTSPAGLLGGFALVWITGSVFALLTAYLGISGRLWNLGLPRWLILFTMCVGAWQWFWITPALFRLKRRPDRGLYAGLLWGGILFTVMNVITWTFLFFKLRHFSMQ